MFLLECFEKIEDPRDASGRRYPLVSIMKMLIGGLLSGRKSLAQIVLWCRSLSPKMLDSLGFKKNVPCVATLSNILRRIPAEQVESVLMNYTLKGQPLLAPGSHLALDGKTLRGSQQEGVPLVHLLSVFVTNIQGVLGQVKMAEGENEITSALRLLEKLPIEGCVITGDAIFTQKKSAI